MLSLAKDLSQIGRSWSPRARATGAAAVIEALRELDADCAGIARFE